MSMKKLKGKFRLSSSSSVTSQVSMDEWSKYDERLLDYVFHENISKLKETLKKKGVSPVKLSRDGQTAMHRAVKKGVMEAVDCMISEQPDLSTTDIQGRTVYHIAALNGDTIMLKKLLDYSRWNLDIKDANEMTALHYAVRSGKLECVKLLIDNSSLINVKDAEGRTPLLLAVNDEHEKIAFALILHGVDVNITDNKDRSPLLVACAQGMCQVAALLLSKGADASAKDSSGRTAMQVAEDAGQSEVVDVLQESAGVLPDSNLENNTNSDMVNTNDLDGNNEKDESGQHMNGGAVTVERRMMRNSSSGSAKRNSLLKHEDNSFTSSIIESLMGFDVSSDTISEMSATEDQLHMKLEDDRKELEEKLNKRNLRLEEMEAEMVSVKNKLKLETEMRFAAEKEVLELKSQLELLMENAVDNSKETGLNVTFGSVEHLPGDDTVNEDDHVDGSSPQGEDGSPSQGDEENGENEEKEHVERIEEDSDSENYEQQVADSDSDESVSRETGYRKKSLGTAKQHIDMLEEHILSLEEDLLNKDNEICSLEVTLKHTKELIDLNNNTTVSLEVYNELKADNKNDRASFKGEIRTLQNKISKLEETDCQLQAEKAILESRILSETELSQELKEHIQTLQEQVNTLQRQLEEYHTAYQTTIEGYRTNLVAFHQESLDSTLKDILSRIVKLRSG